MKRLIASDDLSKLKDLYNKATQIVNQRKTQLSNVDDSECFTIIKQTIKQLGDVFKPELKLTFNFRTGINGVSLDWTANGYTGGSFIEKNGTGLQMFVEDLTMAYYRKVMGKENYKTPTLIKELTAGIKTASNGVLFTPVEGDVYLNKNGSQYKCIEVIKPYTAIMKSVDSGWTCKCYTIRRYEDNTIEWDYSTGGRFAKRTANLKNEKEIVKEIKEEVKNKIEKPYFNFRDVFYLVEEDKVKDEYNKVKDDYTSFKDFCKKNGYAQFDINKRNFTNEYLVNRFLDENDLEIETKPVEAKLKKKAQLDSNEISEILEQELASKGFYTGVSNRGYKYFFKIEGDWKHDHLYAKEIVADKLNEMIDNGEINRFEYSGEDVIEEDGSDYYTAIHSYIID